MHEEDQDKSLTPGTKGEALLQKVDRRDKIVRIIEVAILLLLAGFNIFSAIRLQDVVDQNHDAAIQRSELATRQRQEQKDYIKCVLLIRFDVPPEQLTTREGTEKALDDCAEYTKPH
jgi:hypothetical protein